MDMEDTSKLKIFTGTAHPALAKEISDYIGVPLGKAICGRFNNGEIQVMINESVRGKDCFIIQPTGAPVNDNLMEMLIMVDALKRASARHITVVVPYYGYARQDRKTRGREPISAKLVADLMSTAGVTRVVTMDLHAGQIQGFFDIPVDNLMGAHLFSKHYVKMFGKGNEDLMVVSPDVGSTARARAFSMKLGVNMAIVDKRREKANQSEVMNIIGNVEGKTCILLDDIVDTAGSLCGAAKAIKEIGGAKEVYACATHGVLSGPANERIANSCIKELTFLNTIPPLEGACSKIKYLSVAPMFGEAIERIYQEISIAKLFN